MSEDAHKLDTSPESWDAAMRAGAFTCRGNIKYKAGDSLADYVAAAKREAQLSLVLKEGIPELIKYAEALVNQSFKE